MKGIKLTFTIEYRTQWGEELRLIGSIPELGNNIITQAIPLQTQDGKKWTGTIELKESKAQPVNYSYLVFYNNKLTRQEWNETHRCLHLEKCLSTNYIIQDAWRTKPVHNFFYSSAFKEVWLKRNTPYIALNKTHAGILIKAYAPNLKSNEVLAVAGNQTLLGEWDSSKALLMSDLGFPEWQQMIPIEDITFPLEYKFVVIDKKTNELISWENNPNRYLTNPHLENNQTLVISDRYTHFDQPLWKAAGTAVPVFSLRTDNSCGIGEFMDIIPLVNWAKKTQQQLIQLLPINDTSLTFTKEDSYPYRCVSSFALHPIYISIDELGINETPYSTEYIKDKNKVNHYKFLDYDKVIQLKLKYTKLLFKKQFKELNKSKSYQDFLIRNNSWLMPYVSYMFLKKQYKTPHTALWDNFKVYTDSTSEAIKKHFEHAKQEFDYISYLQYHLDKQLKKASTYANKKGIVLKGDLPIGIGRHSVESWVYPELFYLESQAGAPPDAFAKYGQNWGFPTYNWNEMAKDNYAWWKARLQQMANYFDAYRIDHILGFFRIWSIPYSAIHGLLGQFYPAYPLSKEEIKSKDLQFNSTLFTSPYISKQIVKDRFVDRFNEIESYFFTSNGEDLLKYKSIYSTQRDLVNHLQINEHPLMNAKEIEFLLDLYTEVLFLVDNNNPNLYHPRIEGQHTQLFQTLPREQQEAFVQIHTEFFYTRHNEFWQEQALTKLPALIEATKMLVCGEDLGMIPDSVPWVMNKLDILSLEVQRMPKKSGIEFEKPTNYPYASVSTLSTHDMSTIRGWWDENEEARQRYYRTILGQETNQSPNQITEPLAELIIKQELGGNSLLSILALQDWLSLSKKWYTHTPQEEQINIPAHSNHYWRYRMPYTIEGLINDSKLNKKISDLITTNKRDK